MQRNPTVLRDGAQEFKGQDAKLSIIVGAMAVADLVKSTLGPKGMDKILQSQTGDITVTNDGATILRKLTLDNPAAKILVDISKTQDEEVGDGTTTVCILAGALLEQADPLLSQRLHPQTIIEGWRMALQVARKSLEDMAWESKVSEDEFRKYLFKIAKTTLSSKIVHHEHDLFANLCVDATMRLRGSGNLENIHIIKKQGGSMRDSFLAEGFILDKKIGVGQPKMLDGCKVLIANTPMDTDKIKIYGAKVKVDSLTKVAEIEAAEVAKMIAKCEKIKAVGCNVFINRQLIYNKPEQFFTDNGIMSIEHADFEGVERLSAVLGGEIASTFDHPEMIKMGACDRIEEVMIGEDKLIAFKGCKGGEACTLVLRGASTHILDEMERFMTDKEKRNPRKVGDRNIPPFNHRPHHTPPPSYPAASPPLHFTLLTHPPPRHPPPHLHPNAPSPPPSSHTGSTRSSHPTPIRSPTQSPTACRVTVAATRHLVPRRGHSGAALRLRGRGRVAGKEAAFGG